MMTGHHGLSPMCALLALLALPQCVIAEEEPEVHERVFHHLDLERIDEGRWVKYEVELTDSTKSYRISVVKKTEAEVWIESDRDTIWGFPATIILYKIDPKTGLVRTAHWKKADGSIVLLAILRPSVDPKAPKGKAEGKSTETKIEVNGEEKACRLLETSATIGAWTKETKQWVLADGVFPTRAEELQAPYGGSVQVNWDVKPAAGGTVVRREDSIALNGRQTGDTVELVESGSGAKPTIDLEKER